ncbi:MAG: HepT-like ribonuclease domain-containing protein [Fibrobacterota bacterium]
MYDKALAREILDQIHRAAQIVLTRSQKINAAEDFLKDESGLEKLDAVCMKLIAIGEGLKNFDRVTEKIFLVNDNAVDWKKAMGMRDIITHHYFDLDAEVVFSVCKNQLKPLAEAILKLRKSL